MNSFKAKEAGGLVLKKRTLEKILKEPGTIGLAFAVNAPGRARDVGIKVLRVYEDGNKLVGEERRVWSRRGAPSTLQHPTRGVRNFKFKFLKKLESDKFGFGFYLKEQFATFIKGKEDLDEVFIGGGKTTYTDTDIVEQDEWFTFTISLRKSMKCIALKNGKPTRAKDTINLKNSRIANSLPATRNAIIGISDLEENEPELFNGKQKVSTFILDASRKYVTGIVFLDGNQEIPVMFKKDQQVKSVLLTEDQTLRKIILDNPDSPVVSALSTETDIGWFPNADHTLPCPPHWPREGGKAETNKHENTVKDAVLECLGFII